MDSGAGPTIATYRRKGTAAGYVRFVVGYADWRRTILLDRRQWDDMGQPDAITVLVDPVHAPDGLELKHAATANLSESR